MKKTAMLDEKEAVIAAGRQKRKGSSDSCGKRKGCRACCSQKTIRALQEITIKGEEKICFCSQVPCECNIICPFEIACGDGAYALAP